MYLLSLSSDIGRLCRVIGVRPSTPPLITLLFFSKSSKPEVVGLNPDEIGRIFRVCKNPVSYKHSIGVVSAYKIPIALLNVKELTLIILPLWAHPVNAGKIKVVPRRRSLTCAVHIF